MKEQDPVRGKTLVQKHANRYVVQNRPEMPLTREELDHVYGLPYTKIIILVMRKQVE